MEGYCVKCKEKVEIENQEAGFNKRGSAIVFGTCPHCGTKVFRIGRCELHDGMTPPKREPAAKKPKTTKKTAKKK